MNGALAPDRCRVGPIRTHRTLSDLLVDLEPDQPLNPVRLEERLSRLLQRVRVAVHGFALLVDRQLGQSRLSFPHTCAQGGGRFLSPMERTYQKPPLRPVEGLP